MLRPVFLLLLLLLSACSSTTTNRPDNPENICDIFRQNEDWYDAAKEMQSRWKVPLTVSMAMMYQESSFRHDAKPPMDYFLFIPLGRRSSAYGYAQVKDETWDDYITKPFNPIEVSARVKSQLRRYMQLGGGTVRPDVIRVGGIELDDKEKRVMLDGELVALTPTEYEILKLLIQNPGQVFSPKEIYTRIWNDLPLGSENTVAVHIRHLREKLEINPAEPRYLKVVWGQGYKCEKQG
jgi:DNA-binding winged helix-turn-helix (wHTH) protein